MTVASRIDMYAGSKTWKRFKKMEEQKGGVVEHMNNKSGYGEEACKYSKTQKEG